MRLNYYLKIRVIFIKIAYHFSFTTYSDVEFFIQNSNIIIRSLRTQRFLFSTSKNIEGAYMER